MQPMTLQTNTTMIMKEPARRYLESKWPLFKFVFITDIRKIELRCRELAILVDNNYYTFWNRTLDLNKLLMLKEITKMYRRETGFIS